uniref:Uncharacterized protein n=1 Tax=Sparus aurata TaxID=8175 RepID=A0A671X9M8_SPAAU
EYPRLFVALVSLPVLSRFEQRRWLHVHFWIHKKDIVTRIKCYSRLLTISLQEITQRMYTCVCITLKVCGERERERQTKGPMSLVAAKLTLSAQQSGETQISS